MEALHHSHSYGHAVLRVENSVKLAVQVRKDSSVGEDTIDVKGKSSDLAESSFHYGL